MLILLVVLKMSGTDCLILCITLSNTSPSVRFEVFTAVTMKIAVF
jgi:hypothetical protein